MGARPDDRPALAGEVERARADPRNRVGSYVLLGEIGSGGMGSVHRAWDAHGRGRVPPGALITPATSRSGTQETSGGPGVSDSRCARSRAS